MSRLRHGSGQLVGESYLVLYTRAGVEAALCGERAAAAVFFLFLSLTNSVCVDFLFFLKRDLSERSTRSLSVFPLLQTAEEDTFERAHRQLLPTDTALFLSLQGTSILRKRSLQRESRCKTKKKKTLGSLREDES